MKTILLFFSHIVVVSLLSGCLSFTNGYCEGGDVVQTNTPKSKQVPLSYSVVFTQCQGTDRPIAGYSPEKFRKRIGEALMKTGLFSSVQYSPEVRDDAYHVHFEFQRAGTSTANAIFAGIVSGWTLFLIPTGEDFTLDGSAEVYLRGKAIGGLAEAERVRVIYWLPFLPFFISGLVSVDYMDGKVVNSIVNDVVKFHIQEFGDIENSRGR